MNICMSVRYICLIISRFYFVGDEDLLEIIGNSKDVAIVQRHFTKMYAGIKSLSKMYKELKCVSKIYAAVKSLSKLYSTNFLKKSE